MDNAEYTRSLPLVRVTKRSKPHGIYHREMLECGHILSFMTTTAKSRRCHWCGQGIRPERFDYGKLDTSDWEAPTVEGVK